MLRLDAWREVFGVLRRNKLRSILTGLAVGWGMLVLVALLGAGQGLHNSALAMFSDDAVNSIWVYGGKTQAKAKGFGENRYIRLTLDDHEATKRLDYADKVTSRFYFWNETYVRYGDRQSSYEIRAVHPDHRFLEMTLMRSGRFINEKDIAEKRKVAVVGAQARQYLFRGVDPIGKYLQVNNTAYLVVGLFSDDGREAEEAIIYVPITTAQQATFGTRRVQQVMFTLPEGVSQSADALETDVRKNYAARHSFDPKDIGALRVRNNQKEFESTNNVFRGIRFFIFAIGLGTIIAGIIGVGNIMLISVRERVSEFGLRKAIGAKPREIIGSVLAESMLLTLIAGYTGMIIGFGLLEIGSRIPAVNDKLRNMSVDLSIAFGSLGVLVACGAIAGLIPAYRAAKLNPVEALRAR